MQDTNLYEKVLGLETPWEVVEVRLKSAEETVEVQVRSTERWLPCPDCGALSPQYDTLSRRWRHLDTCQFQTVLCAEVPRVKCAKHGVKQVLVPWADRMSKFTALFEARVIRWLQEASISAVAELFGLSWTAVDGIQKRAVRRGLKRQSFETGRRLPERLGMDETSFQKRHEYVTVFCDQDGGNVVYVADGRKSGVVEEYLAAFSESERAAVKTVAMDMWQGYITPILPLIPEGEKKVCFDKFHMAQHPLRTTRAWALKEAGKDAWRYRSRHWARAALQKWYGWAIRSRLEPVKKVARMVKKHLEGLVNAIHHGVTNARSEGINSRIQWIKYTSRGFRNRDRFRNAIYFHLGGLDMAPEALKPIRLHTR